MDLIIIGSGPGGMDTAIEALRQGKEVLLIEKDLVGGTCLNRGCIPTKALLTSAKTALGLKELSSDDGFSGIGEIVINHKAIAERKNRIVNELRDGALFSLSKASITYGEAEFKDEKTVTVNGLDYQADKIIIATGSQPARLPIPGAELALTSDDLLESATIWDEGFSSFAIIGGGVIGIEFATVLKSLYPEKDITVVEYCKEILPPFDKEIAKRLRMSLTKQGVKFVTGAAVKEIKDGALICEKNGNDVEILADKILMATGRKPVFPKGLEKAGIEYSPKGIKVDPHTFVTTNPNVYAIGDVNGICMLAHAATAQGKRVIGEDVNIDFIPSAVFSIPECAMVGLTEDVCKAQGLDYKVNKAFFRANGKAVCMGETDGLLKIIVDSKRHILGAHIMGPHASDLIAEIALAMSNGLTANDITATIHAHPTLNEIIVSALNE